jgi:serine/threonine-protein kinase
MNPESSVDDIPESQLRRACIELARRLRAGTECRTEEFLPALADSGSADEDGLELAYTEFVVRQQLGQQPNPDQWYARFPDWRQRLERLFQIGDMLGEPAPPDVDTVAETPTPAAADSDSVTEVWHDEYEVLEKLGRGGMGVVYKARQVGLDRLVALKMMRGGDDAGAEAFARFRREAENMARLHHPNIVQVYAVGEREGRPFFSMELAEGGSLSKKIDGKPQPARQAALWVEALARATHYAHQQNIIHRDLKPGNVVLTTGGVPKITDFGLSKWLDGESGHTRSGSPIGTIGYTAPEQAAGKIKEIGPRSDVYALGAILYELLTGAAPFAGDNYHEKLHKVLTQLPELPRKLNPLVDRVLEAICLKCLEKKPRERYASAETLADDLSRWLRGESTLVRPLRWTGRVRQVVRRHASKILIGAALAAASVLLVVSFLRQPSRALEDPRRDLAAKRKATLIGETGPPRFHNVRTISSRVNLATAPDGAFSVQTGQAALVELLIDPLMERYRLSAEVRHDAGDLLQAEVGVYFMHGRYDLPQRKAINCFCALSFNELWKWPGRPPEVPIQFNPVSLTVQSLVDTDPKPIRVRASRAGTKFTPAPHVWRKVAVEVTPEKIRVFWEGHLIGELSRKELMRTARNDIEKQPLANMNTTPQFPARGGLGLFVYNGSASFRRVTIEPLAGEN